MKSINSKTYIGLTGWKGWKGGGGGLIVFCWWMIVAFMLFISRFFCVAYLCVCFLLLYISAAVTAAVTECNGWHVTCSFPLLACVIRGDNAEPPLLTHLNTSIISRCVSLDVFFCVLIFMLRLWWGYLLGRV